MAHPLSAEAWQVGADGVAGDAAPPASPTLAQVFEQRWRKAYAVRALEHERHTRSQPTSRRSSADLGQPPAASLEAAGVHAEEGDAGAAALSMLHVSASAPTSPAKRGVLPACSAHPSWLAHPGLHQQEQQPVIRQQEVEDEWVEAEACALPASSAAPERGVGLTSPKHAHKQPQQQQAGDEGEEENGDGQEEQEPNCRVVWDASSTARRGSPSPTASPRPADPPHPSGRGSAEAATHKESGNQLLREGGDASGALECYTQALAAARAHAPAPDRQQLAQLLSNRAHALNLLGRHVEAATDAQAAHVLLPAWSRPLLRLAAAQLGLGRAAEAVATCRRGHAGARVDSGGRSEFSPLLDAASVAAAAAGDLCGYDGDTLEVRSAGDEAWLGGPAPHVPELDGPLEGAEGGSQPVLSLLPGGGSVGSGTGTAALTAWGTPGGALARRRTSFRSLREAAAAARDGDRILLRRGVHNGMGESVRLARRVVVEGEGALGEAVLDQRANTPALRVLHGGVVLRNLLVDQAGFREAVLVEGGGEVAPLLEGCEIKCSGDDAVNVGGAAAPTLRRCRLAAKKCGLRAFGGAAPRLEGCLLEECGEQGVKACERAAPTLQACTVRGCGEEGVVGTDSATLTLLGCTLRDCKGPALDLSGAARARMQGGTLAACVGGVWMWERTSAELRGVELEGGPSHVLLADGQAAPDLHGCRLHGSVHAPEAAWQGILHPSNQLVGPERATDFPPEEGPFRFVPNRFTRKQ